MKRILGLLLLLLVLLRPFGEESQGNSYRLLSGMDLTSFTISGSQAWDRFYVNSVVTGAQFSFPIEEYPGQFGIMAIQFKKPLLAAIDQLDGVQVSLDTGTQAYFFGVYSFTGYLMKRTWNSLNLEFYGGPGLEFLSVYNDGNFLAAMALEVGADLLLPINERFYTGAGLNGKFFFWGIHNMGDPERYDGSVKNGFGFQIRAFVGLQY